MIIDKKNPSTWPDPNRRVRFVVKVPFYDERFEECGYFEPPGIEDRRGYFHADQGLYMWRDVVEWKELH